MSEVAALVVVSLAGLAVVDRPGVDPWLRVSMAPAIGVTVATMSAAFLLATIEVLPASAVVIGPVVVAVAVLGRRRRLFGDWRVVLAVVAWVSLLGAVTQLFPLGRVTPDSFRYLIAADLYTETGGLEAMNQSDLVVRLLAAPVVQVFGFLSGADHAASAGPVVGMAGILTMARMIWIHTSRRPWLTTGLAVAFVLSANRPVYDLFYINAHGLVATNVLVAAYGIWRMTAGERDWTGAVAVAASILPLARAEGGIVLTLLWLGAVAATTTHSPALRRLSVAAVPPTVTAFLWFGVVAWPRIPEALRRETLFILASVLGPLLLCGAGSLAPRLARVLPGLALASSVGLLAVFAVAEPSVLLDSLDATIDNLVFGSGAWGFTWPAVILGVIVALLVGGVERSMVWSSAIVGFAVMFWLLPYLRDAAYRTGTGDSGNRMLVHILLATIVYVVLTLTGEDRSTIEPR